MHWRAMASGVVLLVIGCLPVAADEEATYRGRLLIDVLQELQDRGLDVVFSSAVVSDELRVIVEPSSIDPRGVLDEILAPLGLEAKDGPAGSVLILARRREPTKKTPTAPHAPSSFVTEVVVTPGQYSVVRQEQASRLTVEQGDAVLVPTFGGDISRVVERLPAVTARDNSAAFHARGSLVEDVSLILDGLELYDPFHLQSFQSPFTLIDSTVVDRIDFFGGGFTADLGDRHGGFVKIVTLPPETSRQGEIELGTLNSRVSYGAPTSSGNGSWLVSVRGWYPEAFRDTIELGGGERNEPRFGDAYVKAAFNPSPRTLFSVHSLLAYDRLEFLESSTAPVGPDNERVTARTRSAYVWLRSLSSWWDGVTSETVLSGGRIEREREGIGAPQDDAFVVDDDRDIRFFGLAHDTSWHLSDSHLLKIGGYLRTLEAGYRYSLRTLDGPGLLKSIALDPDGTSVGLYVAYRARVADTFATEVGLRWDRQTYAGDGQLSPRVNAIWKPGERTELRLGFGRFYQSQRIHELRVEDDETSFSPAEDAKQAELTLQHRFDEGPTFRLDAYYRRLSDLRPRYENLFQPIELFPETGSDRVEIAPDGARLQGVELLLRGDTSRSLAWWVSYVLSSARDKIEGANVPRGWDQTHAGKFLLGYRWGERWSLSLTGTAHTGWPTTPVVDVITTPPDVFDPVLGPRNSIRFDRYVRLDLKARRAFTLPKGRLWLTLEAVNLLDRNNACCVDEFLFEALPDEAVGVTPVFDYWLGFTPSFAVLWDF